MFAGVFASTETDVETNTDTGSKSKTEKASSTSDKEYIIIKSKNYTGKNVHVLFGGMHTNPSYSKNGYDTDNMKKYVPFLNNIKKN
jgi:hypothetical protein